MVPTRKAALVTSPVIDAAGTVLNFADAGYALARAGQYLAALNDIVNGANNGLAFPTNGTLGSKRKWYEGRQGTTGIEYKNLPFIIPFDTHANRACDRCRVFCKAVSNGRPFEPIDIMLGVQCI